jgi:dipeptidase D
MGRLLSKLSESFDLSLVSISGGTKDNAITRENIAVVSLNGNCDEFKSAISAVESEFKAEFSSTDPDMFIKAESVISDFCAMNEEATKKIISLLNELPYGVIAMSKEIEGLVETSLNLGTLKTAENSVHFGYSVRSSVDNDKEKLLENLVAIADKHGASNKISGRYPGWAFRKDSPLQQIMADVYKGIYGKEMLVTAIHAGLECGLFCGKISGLDCVSLGPDLFDIHTPAERMSISSVKRVWEYLLCVLEKL